MESLTLWGKAPILTVEQAAFLSVGMVPCDNIEKPENVKAMLSMLANAINSGLLNAEIICKADRVGWNHNTEDTEYFYRQHKDFSNGVDVKFYKKPDWSQSTVKTEDLKIWLSNIGIKYPSLFTEANEQPGYLNKDHPRYSVKLAASVKTWLAMEDNKLLSGKTPKTAILGWLKGNYLELGLIHEGNLNKYGIEECAKVANWNDKGGAPKTPSS